MSSDTTHTSRNGSNPEKSDIQPVPHRPYLLLRSFGWGLLFLAGLLASAAVVFLTVKQVATKNPVQDTRTKGVSRTVHITILPASQNLLEEGTIQIWANSEKPLAFVRVVVTFDTARLELTRDIEWNHAKLNQLITKTPKADANASGKITLVAGLDPKYRDAAPTGAFKLATIHLKPKNISSRTFTQVSLTTNDMQAVHTDKTEGAIDVVGGYVTVFPPVSPATSATPTPANPFPTATPTPTDADSDPTILNHPRSDSTPTPTPDAPSEESGRNSRFFLFAVIATWWQRVVSTVQSWFGR